MPNQVQYVYRITVNTQYLPNVTAKLKNAGLTGIIDEPQITPQLVDSTNYLSFVSNLVVAASTTQLDATVILQMEPEFLVIAPTPTDKLALLPNILRSYITQALPCEKITETITFI